MTPAPSKSSPLPAAAGFPPAHKAGLILVLATAMLLTLLGGMGAWLVLLGSAVPAALVMAGACGWGSWPAAWLGFGRRPTLQQVCLATALGLGVLAVATLGLGCGGLLSCGVGWALVIGGMIAGLVRIDRARRAAGTMPDGQASRKAALPPTDDSSNAAATGEGPRGLGGALLLVVALLTLAVPLAVMLQGAGVPPGILWNDEARAYDALEYHLQCPREYYDAGRIQFLPHNVYASFPQQMELLYLLLMHLLGGPHAAAIAAQFLHALCGILAVMAIAAWTPAGWARVAAIVAAGSTPWLAYLGCLAYVELGMVAFGAVAAGILVEQVARGGAAGWKELLAAGLCAGLAGGCKYTALALVLVGLMVAWLIVMGVGRRKGALKGVLWLGIGGLVAFSPWLVRNAAFAGNPVYPFAYRWLGGKAWSAEQDEQWHRGHAPPPAIRSLGGRVQTTVNELFGSRMFGPTLFVLAAGGLAVACSNRGRRREETAAAVFLGVAALLIIVGWAALTHMPGRFAVPVIVPLALLVGRGTAAMPRWPAMLLVGLAAAGAAVNDVKTAGEWEAHNLQWKRHGFPLRELAGWVGVVEDADLVNRVAPAQARVWLVGRATPFYITRSCHYTVVFSRDPWLEMARTATPAQAVDWLRTQGVTHVVFSWPEIERLRRTYGFPEWVTKSWVQTLTEGGLRRAAIPPDAPDTGEEVYEVLAK